MVLGGTNILLPTHFTGLPYVLLTDTILMSKLLQDTSNQLRTEKKKIRFSYLYEIFFFFFLNLKLSKDLNVFCFTDPTKGIPLQLLGYFKVKTGLKVTGCKVGRDHNEHI